MSHSHCRKCHTFVASVVSVELLSRKCRITNDTMKILDTTPKTCWKKKPHDFIVGTKCFSMGIHHLSDFWKINSPLFI
jgi:hypothetical protein